MLFLSMRKKKEIKELFQSMTLEDIELILEENNHDKAKTVRAISLEREKRKMELQARNIKEAQKK